MKTYRILYIDDEIVPVEILKQKLESSDLDYDFIIHWAVDVYMGAKLIESERIGKYDLVICDIQGTSLNINVDILPKYLTHNNLLITSSIFIPQSKGIRFVGKDNLSSFILDSLVKK